MWRCSLQHGVGIGAAKPKGIDAGQQAVLRVLFQRRGGHWHLQPQTLKVERGIRRVKMQIRRHHAVLQAQRHFDQPRDA